MSLEFDIVVCVGPRDIGIVTSSVSLNKKNILGYRNLYLVCADPTITIEGAITIDENIFPFTMKDMEEKFGKNPRNGWYLQQLLKFYSGMVIPGILPQYLVVDSDTHFLKPTAFFTEEKKQMLTTGTEFHKPYFSHMNRLHPILKKTHPLSGICHHCFFDTECVSQLFTLVEEHHNNKNAFWEIFLQVIDKGGYLGSGASEYEIYFTYMYIYHRDKIHIRKLQWENTGQLDRGKNCDFVSVHWYMRPK
jgi:hypothetical protein